MDRTYDLNELAMMSGFTTRTLRTYLAEGLLKGEKVGGAWRFTAEQLEAFFNDPYVKEGLRIKRSSLVFDFLADRHPKTARACLILDLPASLKESNELSVFFCRLMEEAQDVIFTCNWDNGTTRVILSGDQQQVARIAEAYHRR
jgi:hypothetical protein